MQMPQTSNPKRSTEDIDNDLDALRVFVAALAEVADQSRLREAAEEFKREHIERLHTMEASDDEVADFIAAFERLQSSY
jgi:hypothetical protein